jgi:ribonuclease BN (tRNA processing enzyme)
LSDLAITVLGCAGTWASAESACSGYLVTSGATRVWVDCGPGTLTALQRHCPLEDLDALVVTHEHPDHCMELPVVRNAMVHGLGLRDLPLYAPRGVFGMLESLVGSRGITPAFLPKLIGDHSVARVGDLRLQFSRTDHPVETLAVRVDDEGSPGAPALAYSSDTGPGWSLAALGEGIGVAVVEATFLAGEVGEARALHRTAEQTGDDARIAEVGRLVVTHVPPTGDGEAHRAEAEGAFGGPTVLARPHETYTARS